MQLFYPLLWSKPVIPLLGGTAYTLPKPTQYQGVIIAHWCTSLPTSSSQPDSPSRPGGDTLLNGTEWQFNLLEAMAKGICLAS